MSVVVVVVLSKGMLQGSCDGVGFATDKMVGVLWVAVASHGLSGREWAGTDESRRLLP